MWDTLYVVTVKSMVEISQNFVAFSEYMNFNTEVSFEQPNFKWVTLNSLSFYREPMPFGAPHGGQ